jgi:hypothetical protein
MERLVAGKTYCHVHSRSAFGYFSASAFGQVNPAQPLAKVLLMDLPHLFEDPNGFRFAGSMDPILLALAIADRSVCSQINVFHATAGFQEPQATP